VGSGKILHGKTAAVDKLKLGGYGDIEELAPWQLQKGRDNMQQWSYLTEKEHVKLFSRAREQVNAGSDMRLDTVQICMVCGWTIEGDAPDICPVCKAGRDRFEAVAA